MRLTGFFIFCLCVAVVCFSLSGWQVLRGQEKRALLDDIRAGLSGQAVDISADLSGVHAWSLVEVAGEFSDREREVFYLLNRVRDGEVGYGLLRILHSSGGGILVDMGWVPLDYEVESFGEIRVSGIVRDLPRRGLFVPDNDIDKSLWYYIDIGEMEFVSGVRLVNFYVSVERDFWRNIANNHLGYSLTWLGLGLIFLVLGGLKYVRNRRMK